MNEDRKVAALFVRRDSIYKTMPGVDCYDIDRDARTFPGGMPIVAHPPSRTWGNYKHLAKAPEGEHELALWAVEQVCKWGGVLEHPVGSKLYFPMLVPGKHVYMFKINQAWFGHVALKPTKIYIVSRMKIASQLVPRIIAVSNNYNDNNEIKKVENLSHKKREETPKAFAEFLVDIARQCY